MKCPSTPCTAELVIRSEWKVAHLRSIFARLEVEERELLTQQHRQIQLAGFQGQQHCIVLGGLDLAITIDDNLMHTALAVWNLLFFCVD